MTQMETFEQIHGRPLLLGMMVKVVSDKGWASDWPDTYQVMGLQLNKESGEVNISLDDDTPSNADGFTIFDVQPADKMELTSSPQVECPHNQFGWCRCPQFNDCPDGVETPDGDVACNRSL